MRPKNQNSKGNPNTTVFKFVGTQNKRNSGVTRSDLLLTRMNMLCEICHY